MSFEESEPLIERYKELLRLQSDGSFTQEDAVDFLSICLTLGRAGFRLTDDEEDWLPTFTPDRT